MRKYLYGGGIVLLCWLNVLAWGQIFKGEETRLVFFDVGQGDAIFLETSSGHRILLDGGPDDTILQKLGEHLPFWERTIDLVILSHPAQDHLQGLIKVLERYKISQILWTGVEKDTKVFEAWEEMLSKEEKEGARVFIAKAGQQVKWSSQECSQYLDIVHPFENLAGKKVEDDNDTSIVARLVLCDKKVLLTGDITSRTEQALVERSVNVDSDILKVAHHGSKTSSSREFIEQVSPEVAVIQVGKENRYGHPALQTLETFGQYGIEVLRTDEKGDISFSF